MRAVDWIENIIEIDFAIHNNDDDGNPRTNRKSCYKIHSLFFFHHVVGYDVFYVYYNISCQ